MPAIDETGIAIARVYADALLDAADARDEADALLAEMSDLLAYLEQDKAFAVFLYSAAVDEDARRDALERALRGRLSDLLLNALHVMNDKRRLPLLPEVYEQYRLMLETKRGKVDVHVTSAHPLPKKLRARLEVVAGSLSGRQAHLVERVDESMIGGLVVQIQDDKYDATLSRRLRQIHDTLIDRASRDIHSGKPYFDDVQT